ncbi:hypothetical protein RJ639_038493 [Escallonia herrerae]|uniref:Pentatricopeptide repeat-containing protein n=1 Tax=Escallonia herrerae TaxID=1293975 RepID=A0AA89B4W3_9ASTE|nr:hypothetical protein RJ639_038493 [Escallonia herrerae]
MACGELGSIVDGNLIHDYVLQNGYKAHVRIANALISMYVKMGRLDLGHEVFSDLIGKDVVSWNTLITGYAQSGNWVEAFDLFLCMKEATNVVPNKVTLLGLLSACGQAENLGFGMKIHGHLIRAGLLSDFRLGTAVVDMYAKCESFDPARAVFEEDLLEKTLVSWNSLIAGYTRSGYAEEAVILYEMMTVELKLKPDLITFSNVVPAYASLDNHGRIQSIHSLIVKKGFDMDGDVVLGTAMIDAYGKCLDLKAAKLLFICIEGRNTATWNALIAAYNVHSHADQVMPLFVEMNRAQELFDAITMVILCQSCGELQSQKQGSMVHGLCHSKGFNSHLSVGNSIVDMFFKSAYYQHDRDRDCDHDQDDDGHRHRHSSSVPVCHLAYYQRDRDGDHDHSDDEHSSSFPPCFHSYCRHDPDSDNDHDDVDKTVIVIMIRMTMSILLPFLFVTIYSVDMTAIVFMIRMMMSILLLFLFIPSLVIVTMIIMTIIIIIVISLRGILIRHKLGSFPPFFDQLDEFRRVYIASDVYQSLFAVYTN